MQRTGGDVDVERVYRHLPTFPLDPETGQVLGERAHVAFACAAMKVVAEVDVELGLTRLVWIGTAQDVGKALNPLAVHGQIEGGTAQGIGLALMEEIQTTGGLITNASFTDYLIPTALDVPPIEAVLVEDPEPDGPYGLKGVGEPPTVVSTAAVLSALRDATGRELARVPVRPDDIAPVTDLARRIAVARGDEPADLVVKGGRVLSVFTREWLETDVAVCDGYVAGLGDYDGEETLDVAGAYVVPGFIDAHMHLESTKLLVDEFARLVLPMGTTAVVADPHEIANVLGSDGIHWLLDVCSGLPLDVYFTASSCVPASSFESPRRPLTAGDLQGLLRRRRVIGLAEMMNFPGVIAGDPAELEKLALEGAAHADGHAPGVLGKALNAYAASGIRSDHEALTVEEGRQRLRAGMWLLIREASMARNLEDLLPLVKELGPVAHGVLHRRPRPRGHRRLRPPEPDGA